MRRYGLLVALIWSVGLMGCAGGAASGLMGMLVAVAFSSWLLVACGGGGVDEQPSDGATTSSDATSNNATSSDVTSPSSDVTPPSSDVTPPSSDATSTTSSTDATATDAGSSTTGYHADPARRRRVRWRLGGMLSGRGRDDLLLRERRRLQLRNVCDVRRRVVRNGLG